MLKMDSIMEDVQSCPEDVDVSKAEPGEGERDPLHAENGVKPNGDEEFENEEEDEAEDEEECAICLEPMEQPAYLRACTHVFCTPCIREWVRTQLGNDPNQRKFPRRA